MTVRINAMPRFVVYCVLDECDGVLAELSHGTGYSRRLKSEQISLAARLFAVIH